MSPQGADSLRRVLDAVFAGKAYAWPAPVAAPIPPWLRWLGDALRWLGDLWRRITGAAPDASTPLLWLLLAVGVALLVHAAFRIVTAARGARDGAIEGARARAPRRDAEWFRTRAADFAARGRFGEAMVAAFHAAMLTLEGRGAARYHPGRTPAELALGTALPASQLGQLRELVRELYRAAFGGEAVSPSRYDEWLATLDEVTGASAH